MSLLLLAAVSVSLPAETPPGLRNPQSQSLRPPPTRNWKVLGIPDGEIQILERFHDGDGHEGFHIAYKGVGFYITGILTRPYIRDEEDEEDEEIKYPLIILNHGSDAGVTAPYRAIALELARRGYVVLASTYRGRAGPEGRSQGQREFAKGEVIDVLQLTQLGRVLEYVDTQRMGILGEGIGGAIALQAIGRSNVFNAAVAISPPVFSGVAEYGYPGMEQLKRVSEDIFGRKLSDTELIRELRARETFGNVPNIGTPLLFITTNTDFNYQAQLQFLDRLEQAGVKHELLDYPDMIPGFLTALVNSERSQNWSQVRDEVWGKIFLFFAEHLNPEVPIVIEK